MDQRLRRARTVLAWGTAGRVTDRLATEQHEHNNNGNEHDDRG